MYKLKKIVKLETKADEIIKVMEELGKSIDELKQEVIRFRVLLEEK